MKIMPTNYGRYPQIKDKPASPYGPRGGGYRPGGFDGGTKTGSPVSILPHLEDNPNLFPPKSGPMVGTQPVLPNRPPTPSINNTNTLTQPVLPQSTGVPAIPNRLPGGGPIGDANGLAGIKSGVIQGKFEKGPVTQYDPNSQESVTSRAQKIKNLNSRPDLPPHLQQAATNQTNQPINPNSPQAKLQKFRYGGKEWDFSDYNTFHWQAMDIPTPDPDMYAYKKGFIDDQGNIINPEGYEAVKNIERYGASGQPIDHGFGDPVGGKPPVIMTDEEKNRLLQGAYGQQQTSVLDIFNAQQQGTQRENMLANADSTVQASTAQSQPEPQQPAQPTPLKPLDTHALWQGGYKNPKEFFGDFDMSKSKDSEYTKQYMIDRGFAPTWMTDPGTKVNSTVGSPEWLKQNAYTELMRYTGNMYGGPTPQPTSVANMVTSDMISSIGGTSSNPADYKVVNGQLQQVSGLQGGNAAGSANVPTQSTTSQPSTGIKSVGDRPQVYTMTTPGGGTIYQVRDPYSGAMVESDALGNIKSTGGKGGLGVSAITESGNQIGKVGGIGGTGITADDFIYQYEFLNPKPPTTGDPVRDAGAYTKWYADALAYANEKTGDLESQVRSTYPDRQFTPQYVQPTQSSDPNKTAAVPPTSSGEKAGSIPPKTTLPRAHGPEVGDIRINPKGEREYLSSDGEWYKDEGNYYNDSAVVWNYDDTTSYSNHPVPTEGSPAPEKPKAYDPKSGQPVNIDQLNKNVYDSLDLLTYTPPDKLPPIGDPKDYGTSNKPYDPLDPNNQKTVMDLYNQYYKVDNPYKLNRDGSNNYLNPFIDNALSNISSQYSRLKDQAKGQYAATGSGLTQAQINQLNMKEAGDRSNANINLGKEFLDKGYAADVDNRNARMNFANAITALAQGRDQEAWKRFTQMSAQDLDRFKVFETLQQAGVISKNSAVTTKAEMQRLDAQLELEQKRVQELIDKGQYEAAKEAQAVVNASQTQRANLTGRLITGLLGIVGLALTPVNPAFGVGGAGLLAGAVSGGGGK